MTISRNARLPLYAQIKQHIEQGFLRKRAAPGERLPSEDELAARYGASRMTVRRAIDQLVSQGKLRRAQGQGTFVVQPAQTKASGVTRWSFERISQNGSVSKKVAQVEEVAPTLRVSNALRTMPAEPIVEITIVLYLDNATLGYTIARIPKLLVPSLVEWELGNFSLCQFLSNRCGLEFGKVEEKVRAVPAEEDAAEILGVEPDTLLLYVDSLMFLASGIPVILSDTFYRGDKYVYRGLLTPLERQN